MILPIPIIIGGYDKLLVRTQQQAVFLRLNLIAQHGDIVQYGYLPGIHFPAVIGQYGFVLRKLVIQDLFPFIISAQLGETLFDSHVPLIFGVLPVSPYGVLLPPSLTFLQALLPAVENGPRECHPCTQPEMAILAGKVADLETAVYEQVELGFVLQVEGAQGDCRIQAV